MPSKFPSFQEGNTRGVFPVITKHRGKYIVLISNTRESDNFNTLAEAKQYLNIIKAQQRQTKKKKTTRKKNKGFFDW